LRVVFLTGILFPVNKFHEKWLDMHKIIS
jgi:hypothetical protein